MELNANLMLIQSFIICRITELWGDHKYEIEKDDNTFSLNAKAYSVKVSYRPESNTYRASVVTEFCSNSETTRNVHELTDFVTMCISDCYIKCKMSNLEYLLE